ncbi:cilia- and flagella-associated protein 299-like [Tachypleus tridentatus]|uniref:cilia- and flagella-associated protein 299-like n=1 Tax=Tachypleus tridentatus TaxID=6853 RepID=UPI003FD3C8CA
MEDDVHVSSDQIVTEFNTYEEFLGSQITSLDLFYLEDEEVARQLVELGYRGSGEILKREDFEAKKQAIEASRLANRMHQKTLASAGKQLQDTFLKALADREDDNRKGNLNTIIFLRTYNTRGQEVSAYIDFAHRLQTEDWELYFSGRKKILPKISDLSYYNWKTQRTTFSPTPYYQVITDNRDGILFKNKKDRKILNVDPKAQSPGEDSVRISVNSSIYLQVALYDHFSRQKT